MISALGGVALVVGVFLVSGGHVSEVFHAGRGVCLVARHCDIRRSEKAEDGGRVIRGSGFYGRVVHCATKRARRVRGRVRVSDSSGGSETFSDAYRGFLQRCLRGSTNRRGCWCSTGPRSWITSGLGLFSRSLTQQCSVVVCMCCRGREGISFSFSFPLALPLPLALFGVGAGCIQGP